ncbi:MAG: 1-acyl-sn-glycerol-3-phosphate acyltransferase [Bacteroidetes bacterium]|nr:MAG: 1-acyl-sn-glycerol-3-phosphate acyltransferase [Bacteroidota bacterium]
MSFLFRPFRALFGIYAAVIFIVLLLVLALAYFFCFIFLPGKKAPFAAHHVSRFWALLLEFFFFHRYSVENKNRIDPKRVYVFVANHQSQLDIPLYARSCRNAFRFLAKAELTKIPLLGFIIKKLYITVDRKDRSDRNRSIEIMKRSLDSGFSVFICPEGTRNRKKEPVLLDFRDGAFRLAILTGTPLAVLTVFDSGDKLSPNRPVELAPGIIRARWSEPIETKNMSLDDLPPLKEKVRQIMETQIREYRAK